MNGYLIIGLFTLVLVVALYLLQSRQQRMDIEEEQEKKIEDPKPEELVIEEKPVTKSPPPETVEPSVTPSEEELENLELIPGIGPTYRTLLREANVSTVDQVAGFSASDLNALLLEINERESITKRPPTLANIEAWIESAKSL